MTVVLEMVSSFVVSTFVAFVLVGFDERRLDRRWPHLAARAWPPASKLSALVVFNPLSLVVHFVRTRRSLRGLVLGVAAAAVVLAASELTVSLVDRLAPEPSPEAVPRGPQQSAPRTAPGLPAPTSMNHGAVR